MIKIPEGDIQRVAALLHVVEKCAGHSGKLMSISNAAMAELLEINDGIKKDAADQAMEAKAIADQAAADEAARNAPPEETVDGDEVDDDGTIRPSVFPADSQTATIADRRI